MDERQIRARIRENLSRAPMSNSLQDRTADPSAPDGLTTVVGTPEAPAIIGDRNALIDQAYKTLLGREASPVEILHHARLMRFLPLVYTRRRFLTRLRSSWEAIAFQSRMRSRHESEVSARFDALKLQQEQSHAQLWAQIRALQRSLTEVSYDIVEDIVERQKAKGDSPCAS